MEKPYLLSQINLIVLLALLVTSCTGQSNSATERNTAELDHTTKAEKIDEIVRLYSDYGGFNGSVLAAHEGEMVYKKGFGFANME